MGTLLNMVQHKLIQQSTQFPHYVYLKPETEGREHAEIAVGWLVQNVGNQYSLINPHGGWNTVFEGHYLFRDQGKAAIFKLRFC